MCTIYTLGSFVSLVGFNLSYKNLVDIKRNNFWTLTPGWAERPAEGGRGALIHAKRAILRAVRRASTPNNI